MDLLVVNFQIADSKEELPMRSFANKREDVGDGERYDTRGGCSSLHRKGLTSSRHTICKYGAMITLHDPPNQSFCGRVIDFGIVLVCCENIILCGQFSKSPMTVPGGVALTVVIIPAFFASVGNQTLAPIDRPFALSSRRVSSTSIRSDTDTDEDVALGLLLLGIAFAHACCIICVLECRCAG